MTDFAAGILVGGTVGIVIGFVLFAACVLLLGLYGRHLL